MPSITPQEVARIYEGMKSRRANWESHWQEVANLVSPNRQFVGDVTPGAKLNNKIFDTTAQVFSGRLASVLSGLLTNPSLVWFYLTTGDEELDADEDVREWLWSTSRTMLSIFNSPKVGFYQASSEVYSDLVNFGTAVLFAKSSVGTPLRMKAIQLTDCYIEENSDGVVDQLAFRFCYTAAQALHEFGRENLPEKIVKSIEAGKWDDTFNFAQVVLPRHMRNTDRRDSKNMAWGSYTICLDPVMMVRESGFKQFPFVCPRWTKRSGEVWGRSPGMELLPSIKMCNAIAKTMLVASEKMADPPLQMPDEGFLAPLATYPGGINYYRTGSRDRVEPMFTGANFSISNDELNRHKESIRMGFYGDLFSLPQNDRMTATEVLQRQREQLQLLNPIVGRLISEYLGPLIGRVFSFALQSGMISTPPAGVRGRKLDVSYTSPLAQAQKASESTNFSQFLSVMAPLAEADPTIMQNIDSDKAVIWGRGMYNLPPIFKPAAEVKAAREAAAKEAQAAKQMEMAQAAGGAAKDFSLASEPLQALSQGI